MPHGAYDQSRPSRGDRRSPPPPPPPPSGGSSTTHRSRTRSPTRSDRKSPSRSEQRFSKADRRSPPRSHRPSPPRSSRPSSPTSSRLSPSRSSRQSPHRSNRPSPPRSNRLPSDSRRPSPSRSGRQSPSRSNRQSPSRSSRQSPRRDSSSRSDRQSSSRSLTEQKESQSAHYTTDFQSSSRSVETKRDNRESEIRQKSGSERAEKRDDREDDRGDTCKRNGEGANRSDVHNDKRGETNDRSEKRDDGGTKREKRNDGKREGRENKAERRDRNNDKREGRENKAERRDRKDDDRKEKRDVRGEGEERKDDNGGRERVRGKIDRRFEEVGEKMDKSSTPVGGNAQKCSTPEEESRTFSSDPISTKTTETTTTTVSPKEKKAKKKKKKSDKDHSEPEEITGKRRKKKRKDKDTDPTITMENDNGGDDHIDDDDDDAMSQMEFDMKKRIQQRMQIKNESVGSQPSIKGLVKEEEENESEFVPSYDEEGLDDVGADQTQGNNDVAPDGSGGNISVKASDSNQQLLPKPSASEERVIKELVKEMKMERKQKRKQELAKGERNEDVGTKEEEGELIVDRASAVEFPDFDTQQFISTNYDEIDPDDIIMDEEDIETVQASLTASKWDHHDDDDDDDGNDVGESMFHKDAVQKDSKSIHARLGVPKKKSKKKEKEKSRKEKREKNVTSPLSSKYGVSPVATDDIQMEPAVEKRVEDFEHVEAFLSKRIVVAGENVDDDGKGSTTSTDSNTGRIIRVIANNAAKEEKKRELSTKTKITLTAKHEREEEDEEEDIMASLCNPQHRPADDDDIPSKLKKSKNRKSPKSDKIHHQEMTQPEDKLIDNDGFTLPLLKPAYLSQKGPSSSSRIKSPVEESSPSVRSRHSSGGSSGESRRESSSPSDRHSRPHSLQPHSPSTARDHTSPIEYHHHSRHSPQDSRHSSHSPHESRHSPHESRHSPQESRHSPHEQRLSPHQDSLRHEDHAESRSHHSPSTSFESRPKSPGSASVYVRDYHHQSAERPPSGDNRRRIDALRRGEENRDDPFRMPALPPPRRPGSGGRSGSHQDSSFKVPSLPLPKPKSGSKYKEECSRRESSSYHDNNSRMSSAIAVPKDPDTYDEKGGVWPDEKIKESHRKERDHKRESSRKDDKEKERKSSKRKKSPRGERHDDDNGVALPPVNDSMILPDAEIDFNVASTLPKSWADWLGVIGPPSKVEGGVPTRVNRRPGSLESVRLGPERVVEKVDVDNAKMAPTAPSARKKANSEESVFIADKPKKCRVASEESVSPEKPARGRANSEESVFIRRPIKRVDHPKREPWRQSRIGRRPSSVESYLPERDRRKRRTSSIESLVPDRERRLRRRRSSIESFVPERGRSPPCRRRTRAASLESVFDKNTSKREDDKDERAERREKRKRAASEESVFEKRDEREDRRNSRRNSKEKRKKTEPSGQRHKRARSLESVLSQGSDDKKEENDDWRNKALVPWRKESWAVARTDDAKPKSKREARKEEKGYDPRPSQDLNAWAEWAGKLALITNKRQIQTSWIFEADSASEDSDDAGLTEAEKKQKEERKQKKQMRRERKKKLREQAKRLKLLPQNWEEWKKDRNYREGSVAPDSKNYGPYDDLDPEMDPDFWKTNDKETNADGMPLSKDYKSNRERKKASNIEITNMTKEMIELEKEIAKGPNATNDAPSSGANASKIGIVDQLAMSEKDFDFRDYSGMGIAHRKRMREREEEARLMQDPFYRERQEQKMLKSRLLRTGFTSWTSGGALNSGHVRYTAAHSSLPASVGHSVNQGKDWYWDGQRWTLKEITVKEKSSSLSEHMKSNPNAYDVERVPEKKGPTFRCISQADEDEAAKSYTVVDNIEEWENAEIDTFDADDVWEKDLLLSQNFLEGKMKAEQQQKQQQQQQQQQQQKSTAEGEHSGSSSRKRSRFSSSSKAPDVEDGEVGEEAFLADTMREIRESVDEFSGPIVPRKIDMEGGRRPRAPHPNHAFYAQNAFRLVDGTPSFSFQGLLVYCGTRNDCDWYCQRIMRDLNHLLESYAPLPVYVGFHCQWSTQIIKGYPENKVSLLSICLSPDRCYLFHLSNMSPPGIPLSLRRILEDRRMIKAGHGVHEFFRKLGRDYRLTCAEEIIATSTVDLLDYSVEILGAPATFGPWPMRKLVEVLIEGMVIPRLKKHEVTPWSVFPLNRSMKCYAATEAYASLEIFMCLKMIQCDLAYVSTETMDVILPILNPPPPPPPPVLLPPPPPEEDMEEGEVLSDDEAQAAREKMLKEKEILKKQEELAEKEKADKEKAEKLAKEQEEENAKMAEENKRKEMEEERKRREEEDKGKKDVAAVQRRAYTDIEKNNQRNKFGKFRKNPPPKKESMLKQLVQEFHSQPTPQHQGKTENAEGEGASENDDASGEKDPTKEAAAQPVFITVMGLEEEKPSRRTPPSRRYAASDRVRPLMDYRGRRDSSSSYDPRNDPRDVRYRGSDRSYAREPPSVREPYYARRDRDAAASSSNSSQRYSSSSSSFSRERHPSSRHSPERGRRSPPPKLLSYWENDDFADIISFDDEKKKKSGSSERSGSKDKKENPLPRLRGDFDYYCYDEDAGGDSDEEFNLKYQSYYDMMEAGETVANAGKDSKEGGKEKSKSKEREKGKHMEKSKSKDKKDRAEHEKKDDASLLGVKETSNPVLKENLGIVGKESAENKSSDAATEKDSAAQKTDTSADATTKKADKRKIVIAPLKMKLSAAGVASTSASSEKPCEQQPAKKKLKKEDGKEDKEKKAKVDGAVKEKGKKLAKKMKKSVAEQIACNFKFGPDDADIVEKRLKHLTDKSKKKKRKHDDR